MWLETTCRVLFLHMYQEQTCEPSQVNLSSILSTAGLDRWRQRVIKRKWIYISESEGINLACRKFTIDDNIPNKRIHLMQYC